MDFIVSFKFLLIGHLSNTLKFDTWLEISRAYLCRTVLVQCLLTNKLEGYGLEVNKSNDLEIRFQINCNQLKRIIE